MLLRVTLLILLLFQLALPAYAGDGPPAVSVEPEEVPLNGSLRYLEDPQHQLTLEQVRQTEQGWKYNGESAFNKGYSNSTWWLQLRLVNPSREPLQRLLEISYAALDHVDIFALENGELRQQFILGDKLPYAQRPMDHRYFIAPIVWQPGQTLDLYLRVRTSGAMQAPLSLWEYKRFQSVDFVGTLAQGTYYGGMITIALYNLLIFFVLRDRNYLYYVGFIVSTVITLAAQSGLAFRFLWPEATQWNDLAIVFFTASTSVLAPIFALYFLRIDSLSVTMGWALRGMCSMGGMLIVACFILPYHWVAIIILVNVMVTVLVVVMAGIYALINRVPSARIFMLAWSALLLGAAVVVLSRLGFLPVNLFTEYSTQMGSLLEAVLLSLALAQRINAERRLRFQAQSELLAASQRANAELEDRVQLRTAELEQLNRRLQQLSQTDQLTGLANRRFLEDCLQREWERGERGHYHVSLLLIDVDHFKQVNDRFGHPVGDLCLTQVAQILSKNLRVASDVAARYGGEEFCLLLPHADPEGASAVAERVRQQVETCVLDADGTSFQVTISVGVSTALPCRDTNVAQLIKQADEALYRSKQSGRNQVTSTVTN